MDINHFIGNGIAYNTSICDRVIEKIFSDKCQKVRVLNIVQVTDDELLDINKSHLNHDYYTDIITFRTDDGDDIEQGELYISYERALENEIGEEGSEIRRLIYHGCLHLTGMNDTTKRERELMRREEDRYLQFHVEL